MPQWLSIGAIAAGALLLVRATSPMLEMRGSCERCGRSAGESPKPDLSFECTFCAVCGTAPLERFPARGPRAPSGRGSWRSILRSRP